MAISEKEVLAAARLARLAIESDEVPRLARELSKILDYVDQLAALDTKDVPPTAQVGAPVAPLRPDVVLPGADKAEILRAAARADESGFLVPAVVDES